MAGAITVLAASCRTAESSPFQIKCRFAPGWEDRLLLFSNQEGQLLQKFSVAANTSELQTTLDLPLTEPNLALDYHLVDLDSQGSLAEISTWRGVTNGETVFLKSDIHYLYDDSAQKTLFVKILDGPAIQSAHFPAIHLSTDDVVDCCFDFDLEQKVFSSFFPPNEDLCVRVKPLGSEQYKIGIFNCQHLNNRDTLQLHWADFKDEVGIPMSTPSGQYVQGGVTATLLAAGRTVTLATDVQESPNGKIRLLVPEGWPVQDYAVHVHGQWTNAPTEGSFFSVSRHFDAGETLEITQPDLSLQTAHFQSDAFTVGAKGGDLDLIETRLKYTSTGSGVPRTGLWTIFSTPAQEPYYQLPSIGTFLEQTQRFPVSSQPLRTVRLYQFDQYSPAEVKAGLPFLVVPNSDANAVEQTIVTFDGQ